MARKKNVEMQEARTEEIQQKEVVEIQQESKEPTKEEIYSAWLEKFYSDETSEDEKAGKQFTLLSSKVKDFSKAEKAELFKFTPKAVRKVTPRALDKTFEKNVFKSQVYLQNIRDEIEYLKLLEKEEKLLKSDDEKGELPKVQEEIEVLKKSKDEYIKRFGNPCDDDVFSDMFAFITAWTLNPEKGRDYKDINGEKCYEIYFAGMDDVCKKLITYFVKFLDKPDSQEKQVFKRELKDELEKFCNGWIEYDKDGNISKEVKRLSKKSDIGYKNTYVKFNDEMVTLASAYTYAGWNDSKNIHTYKNSYAIIQHLFKIALAWTFGVFDKNELRQETNKTKAVRKNI